MIVSFPLHPSTLTHLFFIATENCPDSFPAFSQTIIFTMFHLTNSAAFVLINLALFLCFLTTCATDFNSLVAEHPLNAFSQFSKDGPIIPVVMKKYYFRGRFGPSAMHSAFIPRNLTYLHHPSGEQFIAGADFLNMYYYNTPTVMTEKDRTAHGKVHLNYGARVFILLHAFHLTREPAPGYAPVVTGVPQSWKMAGAVQTPTKDTISFGDPDRFLHSVPPFAVAMEVPLSAEQTITIPHPSTILINGDYVRQYSLAFVQSDMSSFPAPALPSRFTNFVTGRNVNPSNNPPIPARDCPRWLHDLYVTPNRGGLEGEPAYWRTWHAMIDPVYWCYFGHEHGSYPGNTYRPAYDYTTYKVLGADGLPADESHGGFKTFTMQQPDNRLVVLTMHVHLAHARRFKQRHHTMILAVVSGSGEVQMELFMKADFGGGHMYMVTGRTPIDEEEAAIQAEVKESGRVGDRIFNVLNIDDNFPQSLNRSFLMKGNYLNGPDSIRSGLYEQWRAAPASCTGRNSYQFGEFIIDVRDLATAMRTQHTRRDNRLQVMHGQSLKRVLMIRSGDIEIAERYCIPQVTERASNGIFYSDPYIQSVHNGPSKLSVRQFVQHEFPGLLLHRGLLRASDPWSGWYEYDAKTGFEHIEMATQRLKN